jgi:hypothetical protein
LTNTGCQNNFVICVFNLKKGKCNLNFYYYIRGTEYEENIPAKQGKKKQKTWIYVKNEFSWWKEGAAEKKTEGET